MQYICEKKKTLSSDQTPSSIKQTYRKHSQTFFATNSLDAIEVTFLNKICWVIVKQGELPDAPTIVNLVSQHFQIKKDVIESGHLINVRTKEVLPPFKFASSEEAYFLAFAKKGKPYFETQLSSHIWTKPFFSRAGRDYSVKKTKHYPTGSVIELRINIRGPNKVGFACPFTHCGKGYDKSCDLSVHFLVETQKFPHSCSKCGELFRRRVLLNQHICPSRHFETPAKSTLPLSNLLGTYSSQRRYLYNQQIKFQPTSECIEPINKRNLLYEFSTLHALGIQQIENNQKFLKEGNKGMFLRSILINNLLIQALIS